MRQLSVVIPAYNEEHRLPATLASVHDFLSSSGYSFEILVVNDGSIDQTAQVVETFAKDHQYVRLLSYQPNRGKGHAIRVGMLAADGELVLMNDADGSSPIGEVRRLLDAIAGGAEVAIGSRAKPDTSRHVAALVHRKFIGNTFNLIVQGLLLPGIYDTQCGFKLFIRRAAQDIFSVQRINGYGFDVEVLYIARIRGYRVEEIAINWANVEGSKVNVFTDSPRMLLEVLNIAWAAWTGKYRPLQAGVLNESTLDRASARETDDGSQR